jgi:hypothetical protein
MILLQRGRVLVDVNAALLEAFGYGRARGLGGKPSSSPRAPVGV